jgi:hypothetical protein
MGKRISVVLIVVVVAVLFAHLDEARILNKILKKQSSLEQASLHVQQKSWLHLAENAGVGYTLESFLTEALAQLGHFDLPKEVVTVGDMVLELGLLVKELRGDVNVVATTYETGTALAGSTVRTPVNALSTYQENLIKAGTAGVHVVNEVDCGNLHMDGTIGMIMALGLDPGAGSQEARIELYLRAATGAHAALVTGGIFLLGQWGDADRLDWWNGEEGILVRQGIMKIGYYEFEDFPVRHDMDTEGPLRHHLTAKGDVVSDVKKLSKMKHLVAQDTGIIWVPFGKKA